MEGVEGHLLCWRGRVSILWGRKRVLHKHTPLPLHMQ